MKQWVRGLGGMVVGVALLSSTASMASNVDADARRLAGLMQADREALMGTQIAAKQGYQQGKITLKTYRCLMTLPEDSFRTAIGQSLKSALWPQQIREAIAFYESPLGRKYAANTMYHYRKSNGLLPTGTQPRFTAQEVQALNAFGKTGAGKKMFYGNIPSLPVTQKLMYARSKELFERCGR